MQQTKSYWRVVLVAGVVSAFVGAACTVSTTDNAGGGIGDAGDGNVAGSPGSAGAGTAGSSTAGSSSAGAGTAGAATAGAGGAAATPFSCDSGDAGATGTPNMNACKMPAGLNACDKCIRTKCCSEYAACYATDPGNQCGYGGPKNDGEFFCYNSCLVDLFNKNGSVDDSDKEMCAANCVTSKDVKASQDCGPVVGSATNDMIGCTTDNCATECYGG